MIKKTKHRVLLSIAGSDNTSGAGIQCDIKTSLALNVFCVTCVSAITSQNSEGVKKVHFIPKNLIISQIESILSEFNVDCIKIGLFGGFRAANSIVKLLKTKKINLPIVVDPVFRSTTKSLFLKKEDYLLIQKKFAELNPIFTPNVDEIKTLLNIKKSMKISKDILISMFYEKYKSKVILTGGDGEKTFCEDFLLDENLKQRVIKSKRIISNNLHGSGCAFSTALCINLSKGNSLYRATALAKSFTEKSIKMSPKLNLRYGPIGQLSFFK